MAKQNGSTTPCQRCGGTKIYRWGAVVNGKSAHSGACFACVGGGQYPPRKEA